MAFDRRSFDGSPSTIQIAASSSNPSAVEKLPALAPPAGPTGLSVRLLSSEVDPRF